MMTDITQSEIDTLLEELKTLDEPAKKSPPRKIEKKEENSYFDVSSIPIKETPKRKYHLSDFNKKRKDENIKWICSNCKSEMEKITVFMGTNRNNRQGVYCKKCDYTGSI